MKELIVRDAVSMDHFTVGDLCFLAEVLHPDRMELPYDTFSLSHAVLAAGGKTLSHKLADSTEVYYVLSGEGQIFIDGEAAELRKDRAVVVPPSCVQHVENTGGAPLVFLCIVTPPWKAENEIVL